MIGKRWIKTLIVGIFCVTGLLAGCGENDKADKKGSYEKITAEEAKEKMETDDSVVVLDVRTQEEYAKGHISGAILIPNESIGTEGLSEFPDKDQEILVYCRSGNRSAKAAKKLAEAGYTKVFDFGGINDWPFETVQ